MSWIHRTAANTVKSATTPYWMNQSTTSSRRHQISWAWYIFFLLLSTVCVIKRNQIAASNLCIYKWPHWSARKKGGDRLSCLSFSTELWLVIFLMKVWDCFLSTLGGYKGIALFLGDFQQQEYESFKQNESAECTGMVRHPKGFPVPWMIPSKARIEDQMHLFHFGQCYFSAW